MSINLPTTLLRSFVAIVDAGSMLGASQQVFLSQSALSFQIKKLEGLVKHPLFQRDGRRLVLTASGKVLLDYARRMLSLHDEAIAAINGAALSGLVRIGIVQDFSDAVLRGVLANFAAQYPDAQVYVKVSRTVQLRRLIADGTLDIVIGMGDATDAAAIHAVPMRWFGKPDLVRQNVVPLALLETPCRFRDAAIDAMERAGHEYRIAVEAPNLSALRAAVDAGLGITCRTALFADEDLAKDRNLPTLPSIGFLLEVAAALSPAADRLRDIASQALVAL